MRISLKALLRIKWDKAWKARSTQSSREYKTQHYQESQRERMADKSQASDHSWTWDIRISQAVCSGLAGRSKDIRKTHRSTRCHCKTSKSWGKGRIGKGRPIWTRLGLGWFCFVLLSLVILIRFLIDAILQPHTHMMIQNRYFQQEEVGKARSLGGPIDYSGIRKPQHETTSSCTGAQLS